VTLTIDVEPGSGPAPTRARSPDAPLQVAGGRRLPPLLFVTSREGLRRNIGREEADQVLDALRRSGQAVYDGLPGGLRDPAAAARAVLPHLDERAEGVVLVGGYDVVPAQRLDVLDPALRASLPASHGDADDFVVWSDDVYGDRAEPGRAEGDGLPEVPVSRIPDGRLAELVFTAVQVGGPPAGGAGRFGVRNVARPFADDIFSLLAGAEALRVSLPTTPAAVGPGGAAARQVYFMLHGSDANGACFWGEDDRRRTVPAVDVGNVPARCPGAVVFAGCCWGALYVTRPAAQAPPGSPVGTRAIEASMALSYLRAGALAFVGCTGSHYSPTVPPYDYFGGPLHREFWRLLGTGVGPARALFEAKREYLRGMPHGQTDPLGRAIERKILRQYTCLGLGW
jgi:hypothetical protein